MTADQVREALSTVFAAYCDVTAVRWQPYIDILAGVNPGDLDDALTDIKRTHGFRNAPLPAEILNRVNEAKRKRINATPSKADAHIDPNEGELKTITIKGIGSLQLRVLPDDHPALRRYCHDCNDTGWQEVPRSEPVQMTVKRCHCWAVNPELQLERERTARYVKERQP